MSWNFSIWKQKKKDFRVIYSWIFAERRGAVADSWATTVTWCGFVIKGTLIIDKLETLDLSKKIYHAFAAAKFQKPRFQTAKMSLDGGISEEEDKEDHPNVANFNFSHVTASLANPTKLRVASAVRPPSSTD